MVLVEASGRGLVEERLTGVQQQAAIAASALGLYATNDETKTLRVELVEALLKSQMAPTNLRARVYHLNNSANLSQIKDRSAQASLEASRTN